MGEVEELRKKLPGGGFGPLPVMVPTDTVERALVRSVESALSNLNGYLDRRRVKPGDTIGGALAGVIRAVADWTCPYCGHTVDTPQHELGCPRGRGCAPLDVADDDDGP